jgi:hypothetical protein
MCLPERLSKGFSGRVDESSAFVTNPQIGSQSLALTPDEEAKYFFVSVAHRTTDP